jgi:hypothetical protein
MCCDEIMVRVLIFPGWKIKFEAYHYNNDH